MQRLEFNELIKIKGGALSFSAALLNAISRTITTVLELGRTIGSSIKMIVTKKTC